MLINFTQLWPLLGTLWAQSWAHDSVVLSVLLKVLGEIPPQFSGTGQNRESSRMKSKYTPHPKPSCPQLR
jgi:hypothetical protein